MKKGPWKKGMKEKMNNDKVINKSLKTARQFPNLGAGITFLVLVIDLGVF
jgi:hypothetical protein